MSTLVRVIDFETTGLPPDATVCEVGWCDINVSPAGITVGLPNAAFCNPGRLIPPEVMAIHHITNEEVADAPSFADVIAPLLEGVDVFAAHRCEFERQFFGGGDVPWICTWKIAIKLAPRAPGHGNQVLRYWLKLAVDPALALPPHRAGPDAYVTAHLLARMLAKLGPEEMVAITAQPAVLPYLTFGKHAMKPIEEVPDDYLEWCLKQDMDADVKHTARQHLNARRVPA